MIRIFRFLVVALGSLILPAATSAAPLDNFNVAQTVFVDEFVSYASSNASSSGAIGGHRTIELFNGSIFPVTVRVRNCTGVGGSVRCFGFSQDANSPIQQGLAVVTWDGDATPGVNPTNWAGGLDLTADGADALLLPIFYLDYPNNTPIEIEFRLYDADDASGATYVSGKITLSEDIYPIAAYVAELPFAALAPSIGDPLDILTSVGAIQMRIQGIAPAVDLEIGALSTNGVCTEVPVIGRPVVDDCGVCSGDNSSCADCEGVPNGNALPGTGCTTGQIGACGEGKYNSSCQCEQVVTASAETCDQIDNDCDGQVDEITDRCGICGGDGRSCLDCTFEDQTDESHILDQGAKEMERYIRKVVRNIKRILPVGPQRRKYRKVLREAHSLQNTNWILSWKLPEEQTNCQSVNAFCAPIETTGIIGEYLDNNLKLWKLFKRSTRELKALQGGTLFSINRSEKQSARKQFKANRDLAKSIPLLQYVCEDDPVLASL